MKKVDLEVPWCRRDRLVLHNGTYTTMKSTTQIGSYCFDDEKINSFSYDHDQTKIEIGFRGYYKYDDYFEKPCLLVIENWKSAKSRLGDKIRFQDFPTDLGIIDMLLWVEEYNESSLKILVLTVDNRCLQLYFEVPTINIFEL